MAEVELTELTELSPVPQGFIVRLAEFTSSQHLERFAITLLGLSPTQVDHAMTDAGQNAWRLISYVSTNSIVIKSRSMILCICQ